MKNLTFTLFCAMLIACFSFSSSYATNPISIEAHSILDNGIESNIAIEKNTFKQTIVGKFFNNVKKRVKSTIQLIKNSYYQVARSAKGWLWLWIVLGIAGFLVGLLAAASTGGLGTFLGLASYAAYIASAVCFVLWIVALVG